MRIITYDCEVFAHEWLVVFKDKESGRYTRIWNDNDALCECISDDCIYIGFNSKHYDQFIIKAIVAGFTPEEVKQVNDYIIQGGQGWECPLLEDVYLRFNNVDIRDDMQQGLSLKAIEGHLGLPIQESNVSFDIDRPLTEAERRETEFYCDHDVDTTEMIVDLRKDYLKNKINLGKLAGISDVKAMSMTNAKLTAAVLKATPKKHDDERDYVYPSNLRREFIPQEVFDFFDRMKDKSIPDDELFKGKLEMTIGECPVTLGFGGIHGAIPNLIWEGNGSRIIRNYDVGSYYPHLITINGYTSRSIPSPKVYEDVLEKRMEAKASGDKAKANALKLVCNTTYGCLLNQYNPLYDPLMARSVCISGQLYLLELAEHMHREIEGLRIIQLNTDGIMVEFDDSDYDKVLEICDEWQKRTGFELEEDSIAKIAQKDVNNYVEVQSNGTAKAKGGYLVRGIAPAGAFNVNNNASIVATALKEYFVTGKPVEDTVNACDDIFQFQIIAKAGAKYKEAYHLVDDVQMPIQKVNRVYATADPRYGKLYKVKAEDDSTAKIEMLPDHCIIDNNNEVTIKDIDKSFYIEMAKKRLNDFLGIKPEKKGKKKMATKKEETPQTLNVFQKLIKARAMFLNEEIKKTGKNMKLEFKYFELSDIVPVATRIFEEVGLLPIVNFTDTTASLEMANVDNPEETIVFLAPFIQITPVVSTKTGNAVMNEMQALGSSITYMRRYLYMIAMDICEDDTIDSDTGIKVPAPVAKPTRTAPATPVERKEVKEGLTAVNEQATDLQIKGLKAVLKKLKDTDPKYEELIQNIAIQTEGFTKVSKSDCEALIQKITAMLEAEVTQ